MEIDFENTPLRRATRADWKQVAAVTAEAFAEDPVNRWVFGKRASIASMFKVMARERYVPSGQCYLIGDQAATMWLPPGDEAEPSSLSLLKFALGQLRHGTPGAIKRGMALAEKMAEWHPKAPHMYLFTVGTRQSARGQGLGKAILKPVLEACDRSGVPVYLENSNPVNSGFYASLGFERLGTFEIGGPGTPIMEPMWRHPRLSE